MSQKEVLEVCRTRFYNQGETGENFYWSASKKIESDKDDPLDFDYGMYHYNYEHLLRNGKMCKSAHNVPNRQLIIDWDILLSSDESSWCSTKEECIALCEKYGYEYIVKGE